MKSTKVLFSNEDLEVLLKEHIDDSPKNLNVFAGHLPLIYKEEGDKRSAYLDVDWWGEFSVYTFEFGCKLLRYALDIGKEGKLMIVVDDDIELKSYKDGREWQNDDEWKGKRRRGVRKKSILPAEYTKILNKYDLNETYLVKQYFNNYDTSLISEKNLKERAKASGQSAPDECSLAYKALLFNQDSIYFDPKKDYHISFIPDQCKSNLEDGIINSDKNVDATYVFFPPIEDLGGIGKDKIGYRKALNRSPISIESCFQEGKVTFIKTTHNIG